LSPTAVASDLEPEDGGPRLAAFRLFKDQVAARSAVSADGAAVTTMEGPSQRWGGPLLVQDAFTTLSSALRVIFSNRSVIGACVSAGASARK
jgi:hypothetical protein